MSTNPHTLLGKLLLRNSRRNSRLWAALLAVCTGTTLLLLAVMTWWNFKELLAGKHDNDSLGSTFLTISKRVTDETMGRPGATFFHPAEIEALKAAPEVQDVGALVSNRFPVYATFSSTMGFATELFLEAVPERFLDKKPAEWNWQPGDREVPIIVSTDFLNLYNYGFALSQGLPQLSESSISSIAFELKAGYGAAAQGYRARVVGFSDRISSVLVPEAFIRYGNETYAPGVAVSPSRLIVRAKDPSDNAFISYLQEHDYNTNAEQLRWNKLRSVAEAIASGTGLLAVLLLAMGIMVFVLFIELTIARAQASLKLLTEIGYSPGYLSRFMTSRFLPLVCVALLFSLCLAVAVQYAAAIYLKKLQLNLSVFPGWPVWVAFVVNCCFLLSIVVFAINRSISRSAD